MSNIVFADSDSFFYDTILKEIFPEFIKIYCGEITDEINTCYICNLESVVLLDRPIDILVIEKTFLQRMTTAGLKIDARKTLLIGYEISEINKDDIFKLFFMKVAEGPFQTPLGA